MPPPPAADPTPDPTSAAPTGVDVRLVVCDMDGTLLDDDGRVPAAFWGLLDEMRRRAITFAPASGRQHATLRRTFAHLDAAALDDLVVIAENGGHVTRGDHVLSTGPLDVGLARDVVRHLRADARQSTGVVWCAPGTAYVDRVAGSDGSDQEFLADVEPYYATLARVPDLLAVEDPPVKLAVWAPGDPHVETAPLLAPYDVGAGGPLRVLVSGRRWVDVQPPGNDKGVAVRRLQEALGVTPAQTVAFGDNFNDVGMLDAAEHAFAMAGAPAGVAAHARHTAPSHADGGVVTVLRALLDGAPDARLLDRRPTARIARQGPDLSDGDAP